MFGILFIPSESLGIPSLSRLGQSQVCLPAAGGMRPKMEATGRRLLPRVYTLKQNAHPQTTRAKTGMFVQSLTAGFAQKMYLQESITAPHRLTQDGPESRPGEKRPPWQTKALC